MTAETTQSERELWRSFFIMRRQLELTLERRLQADAGISTADYEILMSLFSDPSKRLRAGQIGDIIGWEKSRVSHQITRMEQRNLVAREECDADARGVWVVLTEAGTSAVLAAETDRRDAVRQYFFDVLDDDEKRMLTTISHKVLDTIKPPVCSEIGASEVTTLPERRDVVIVGGGHNGLTAATYLALAGKRVTVLERLDHVGGAAVSQQAFEGVDARLSRYSYLVSLLPARIIRDLGLDITLARRRYSSYTPEPGSDHGLLIDNESADFPKGWQQFYAGTAHLARTLFPTVTEPLLTRSEARRALGDDALWSSLIERPIGSTIAETFSDDLVRGVVLTDALIGTFAPNIDETLAGNKCFAYHVIGGGTGDWDVPVGGMGAVTGELTRAARIAGAEIITGAEVTSITPDGLVTYRQGDDEVELAAEWVLANVAPTVLSSLVGTPSPVVEGAQVKVNLLVSRLPRLRDASVDPAAAFGGTFHINETWSQLDTAYETASAGNIPDPLPCEIYCHSLTDPTILSPELRATGAQTLTVFGLHTPDRLVTEATNDTQRAALQAAALASLNSVLAEPIEDLLLTDASGNPTIETKTTLDLEHALGLPGGNIFHGPLSWPFAEDDAELDTPAQRWGVATEHPRILLCGAGAQRGGGVSGIGGHNAAMAVLESGR